MTATTPATDPLRVQLEKDRDRAVTAARSIAARGVTTFEDSASLEQHLDLAERSQVRLRDLSVTEPLIYDVGAPASYFRDLAAIRLRRDTGAAQSRMDRHRDQMLVEMPRLERQRERDLAARGSAVSWESRALGNTNATGGSGGELAPPLWLIDRWASAPRAAAPLAGACTQLPLPKGVSSVNVPLFTSNPGVTIQSTQNSLPSDLGGSTTAVTASNISSYSAYAIVSQQLLDQSPPDSAHFDQVIFDDLTQSAWEQIEVSAINGSGAGGQLRGLLNTPGVTSSTYTSATPTGAAFLTALAQTASLTSTARKRLVSMALMHPRRWFWLASQLDSSNRPLVEPGDGEYLTPGDAGPFGPLFAAVPVYATTAIPTTVNTNQDPVLLTRPEDHLLLTSTPNTLVALETHADSVGVTFRFLVQAAFLAGRYPTATGVLTGSGLAAPAGF